MAVVEILGRLEESSSKEELRSGRDSTALVATDVRGAWRL